MKKFILCVALFAATASVSGQTYKETFDSNSLEWTECAYKNGVGTAIIDKGSMTIASKGVRMGLALFTGNAADVKAATYFETHCYAPVDVMKPFEIHSIVNVKKFEEDNLAGIAFNYKDNGNFYCFSFNENFVKFVRYVDGEVVGEIMQGVRWKKSKNNAMKWSLYSDGQTLTFKVDNTAIMSVRYMPLAYNGFGFYTFGKQELSVDEVEFRQ